MQLHELFKPNQYGHVPIVTVFQDAVLTEKGDLYQTNEDHSPPSYFRKDTEIALTHRGTYMMVERQGVHFHVFHIVPFSAENQLIAAALRGL